MQRRVAAALLTLLSLMLLTGCQGAGESPVTVPWPNESWPPAELEAQNIDAAPIERLLDHLSRGVYGQVDHLILIRNGYQLVDEAYRHDYASLSQGRDQTSHQYNYTHPDWHPFHQGSELHTLQSVTKSVTALLVGIAIERGELPGVEPRVADLLPGDVQPRADERFQRMTVEDLLTMRAGIAWDEHSTPYDDPRNDCGAMEASEDWIAYVLARPMAAEPGEDWVYNSGATMLLSAIMTEATGVTIDRYAAEHLFQPLGITDYYWKITPTGLPDTEGGLYLKPADLARIGYLVLQGGVWGGEQVVPADWVERSTSVQAAGIRADDPTWGYGYLWWLMQGGPMALPKVIMALGYGGQHLFIVPELDLIVVFNAWNLYDQRPDLVDILTTQILPAVGPLP